MDNKELNEWELYKRKIKLLKSMRDIECIVWADHGQNGEECTDVAMTYTQEDGSYYSLVAESDVGEYYNEEDVEKMFVFYGM